MYNIKQVFELGNDWTQFNRRIIDVGFSEVVCFVSKLYLLTFVIGAMEFYIHRRRGAAMRVVYHCMNIIVSMHSVTSDLVSLLQSLQHNNLPVSLRHPSCWHVKIDITSKC